MATDIRQLAYDKAVRRAYASGTGPRPEAEPAHISQYNDTLCGINLWDNEVQLAKPSDATCADCLAVAREIDGITDTGRAVPAAADTEKEQAS